MLRSAGINSYGKEVLKGVGTHWSRLETERGSQGFSRHTKLQSYHW